jgi:hypothetical protein
MLYWNRHGRYGERGKKLWVRMVPKEGPARGQEWYLGGGNQLYVPDAPSDWITIKPWQ